MQLPGLETVLTFAFVENVRLELVTRTRRLLRRHVSLLRRRKANRAHAAVPLRRSALNETASEHLSNSRLGLLTTVVRGESAHVTTSGDGLQNKSRRYAIATRAKARNKAT